MVVMVMLLLLVVLVLPVRMLDLLRRRSRPGFHAIGFLATVQLLLQSLWQPGGRGKGRGDCANRRRADHAAQITLVTASSTTSSSILVVMPARRRRRCRCRRCVFVALLHMIRLIGATVFGCLPATGLLLLLAKVHLIDILALDVIVVIYRRIICSHRQRFPRLRTDGGI